MTIKNAIASNDVLSGFSPDRLQFFADVRGINLRNDADASSLKDVELLTADCYKELLNHPDFKEGSLSIAYDRTRLEAYVIEIGAKYSDDRLKAVVKSGGINDLTDTW